MRFYTATPDYYNDYICHHGVKGQQWGVRNGPPYPLADGRSSSERIYSDAKKRVSKISKDVQTAVSHTSGKMYGLEHKLKTKESISRKIDKNIKEEGKSVTEASNDIKDAVRFTMVSPEKDFVKNYESFKSEMERKGYKETRCKNYFQMFKEGKVKHKSVQCNYATKDGYEFEIQFQTPASQKAKDKKVPIYEERRQVNISKKRARELEKQMEDLALAVKDPPDIHKIKSHK